jgi:hypothetical protein
MDKGKSDLNSTELKHELEKAELLEEQTEEFSLIKAKENSELSGYTKDRDLMNRLIGQVQMSRSISKFTNVVSLTKAAEIKKNKLYRALAGQSGVDLNGNEIADVGTWDGFCRLIGSTRSKMDEDILNLEIFGEETLNTLNYIGAGYREIRKLRKLPDEERELILNGEAIKTGDKEALVDLIEEMVTRHTKEKENLQKKNHELEGDLEATRRVVDDKNYKITELETSLHKRSSMSPDERSKELFERLDKETFRSRSSFLGPRAVIQEIMDWEDAPRDLKFACAQSIARMKIALDELQSYYQLPIVELDIDDSWMNEAE